MMNVIKQHYDAYKKQYDNTVGNFSKMATAINGGTPPDPSQWQSDYAPPAPQATATGPNGHKLVLSADGSSWVPQ